MTEKTGADVSSTQAESRTKDQRPRSQVKNCSNTQSISTECGKITALSTPGL